MSSFSWCKISRIEMHDDICDCMIVLRRAAFWDISYLLLACILEKQLADAIHNFCSPAEEVPCPGCILHTPVIL